MPLMYDIMLKFPRLSVYRMKLVRRRIFLLFSAVSFLVFVFNYIIWRSKVGNKIKGQNNAQVLHRMTRNDCNALLDCYSFGEWEIKPGLTQEMIRERREVDKSILESLGFPGVLHRGDKLCGQGNLLPFSKLPALCDELSETPCCNEEKGLCGNSTEDCMCSHCKDFSKYFAAEFANWKPTRKECPSTNFHRDEACSILNEYASEVAFVGDSFIRHLFVAFSLLVTGDPITGALRSSLSDEERKQCSGEWQFVDNGKHSCHLKTLRNWEEVRENRPCSGSTQFKTYLVEAYNIHQLPLAIKTVTNLLGKPGSVVVLGVGIHFLSNAQKVIKDYLKPLLDLIQDQSGNGWPLLIWANIHQVDNFLPSDCKKNYSPIEKFNQEMSRFCRANNIPILETSSVTRFIKSNDGLHFGYGGNMAKVQILMNYLKNFFEVCAGSS